MSAHRHSGELRGKPLKPRKHERTHERTCESTRGSTRKENAKELSIHEMLMLFNPWYAIIIYRIKETIVR